MGNKNTVIDAKINNLNELTKVLSVKEQAQEQLLVVMWAWSTGYIVQKKCCLLQAPPYTSSEPKL